MDIKKRILSVGLILALIAVLSLVGVWAVSDLDFAVGGDITYKAPEPEAQDVSEYPTLQFYVTNSTNKTVSVQANRRSLPTGDLIIPSKVLSGGEEYTVTSIAYVSGGTLLSSSAPDKQITLPKMKAAEPIVSYHAFNDCIGLTSVIIPDSVTHIETYAFFNCSGLTSIVIPDSVTSIRDYAFANCTSLAEVNIKATSVPTGESSMFSNCPSLLVIYVPMGSVDAYKAATNWSTYSSKIQGKDF